MAGDVASIIEGVESIGELIVELPNDLQDCKDTQEDFKRLSSWVTETVETNPIKFVETMTLNILHNFGEIVKDLDNF